MPYSHLVYTKHAFRRMIQRSIPPIMVRQVLALGEVIENYPDDSPYPSFLILAFINERPIHIAAADDHTMKLTHIITAYEPSAVEWEPGFRKRQS
jgi:hypothetical protein